MRLLWLLLSWPGLQGPIAPAVGSLELIPQAATVAQFEPLFVSVVLRNDTAETLFLTPGLDQDRLSVSLWHEGAWRPPSVAAGFRRDEWPDFTPGCGPSTGPPVGIAPGAAQTVEVMVPAGMLAIPGRYRLTSYRHLVPAKVLQAACEVVVVPHAGNAAWIEAPAISYSRRLAWRTALDEIRYPLQPASAARSWDHFGMFVLPHLVPATVRDLSPGLLLALACANSRAELVRARAAEAGSKERARLLDRARAPLACLDLLSAGLALPSPPTGGLPRMALLLDGECAALQGDTSGAKLLLERLKRDWPMVPLPDPWHSGRGGGGFSGR